ncbi:unnamed protein product [Haemonchus placei]|uniref:BMERB domain-containing protein n=1 Tax=Haemonchus placei TaxID=6290 RepID=A0A158QMY5_HAEPC|nr:unnamed protein product [Haemonchus placei]
MYRRKIDADYIDDYDEDIRQIQLLEDQIRILEQHVRNMEYRIRQKITKRVELELLIKGFHEDQQFDKNFWRELRLEKEEKTHFNELAQQKGSPDDGLDNNIEQSEVDLFSSKRRNYMMGFMVDQRRLSGAFIYLGQPSEEYPTKRESLCKWLTDFQNMKIEEYVEDDTSFDILLERLRERLQ